MATGTANTRPTPPPPPQSRESAGYDGFIQQQLRRTSLHVKVVDLFGGLMVMAATVLGFLLLVAIVDAWVFELGVVGRVVALTMIGACGVVYLVMYVTPLLARRINPQFAARVIEESQPTLKNSLINFLTFRSNRSVVHEVVYEALEQKAATDLSSVPIESAVDRSKLIRVGYVLVGVMIVCGLYKILSPKDPFQTIARIASPFAQISRPARVLISDVEPGNAELFRGQVLRVTARVDGADEDEPVEILYSTSDGQTVDQAITMSPLDGGLDYEGTLSPGDSGIQQDIEYRISAGDAITRFYQVKVLAAPTIVVESIEHDYPDYTRRANLIVRRQGDIRALEGTRVTLRCRANHEIKAAYIELISSTPRAKSALGVNAKSVTMKSNGFEASGQFTLRLLADRRTPEFDSYRVKFVTTDDHRNEKPVDHPIEVTPDLAPEVDILSPTRDVIEVPANGSERIEIRAIDPDYGLTKISLRGVSGGSELLDQTLLNKPTGHLGQAVVHFDFKPKALKLTAGDEVEYWAVAEDNRPKPNIERTRPSHFIRVTPSDERLDTVARAGERKETGKDDSPPKDDAAKAVGGKPATAEKDPFAPSSDEPKKKDETEKTKDSGKTGDPKSSGESSRGGSDSGKSGAGGESAAGKDSGGKNSGGKDGSSSKDSGTAGGSKSGSNSSGGSSAGENAGDGSRSSSGRRSGGGTAREPLHDGEAFEIIEEHRRKNEEKSGDGKSGSGTKKSDSPGDPSNSGETAGEKKTGGEKSGEGGNKSGDSPSSPGGSPGGAKKQNGGNSANGESGSSGAGQRTGQNPDNNGGTKSPGSGSSNGGQPMGRKSSGGEKSGGGEKPSGATSNGGQKNAGQNSGGGQQSGGQKNGGMKPEPGSSGGGQSNTGQKKNGSKPGGGENASGQNASSEGQKPDGGQKQGSGDVSGGNKPMGAQSGGGMQPSGGQQSGGEEKSSGGQKPNGGQQGGNQGDDQKSGGGKSQKSGGNSQETKQQSGSKSGGTKPKSGGQGSGDQGSQKKSGGGKESQGDGGKPQQGKQGKKQGGGGEKKPGGQKSQGGGKSKSGTKSQDSGDRAGQGGAGGGNSSGKSGNDGAGSNSPGDEGNGAADESGDGETSNRLGKDKASDQKTGSPSSQPGAGGQTRPNPSGQKSGTGPGTTNSQKEGSPFGGGGGTADTTNSESRFDGEVPPGEEANLDYARKATDLALEYLKDQKSNPDRELLEKLKWTPEELKKFTERWGSMKRSAKEDDGKGKRELDEALRSLGLRPDRDQRRGAGVKNDEFKGVGDSGGKSTPPAKYAEKFNAFLKGSARVDDGK